MSSQPPRPTEVPGPSELPSQVSGHAEAIAPEQSNITAMFDTHQPNPRSAPDAAATLLQGTVSYPRIRLVCMAPLQRQSGSAEFLGTLAQWASGRPERMVELVWVADGIMQTVLAAQPTPPNLVQRFPGRLEVHSIVDLVRGCQAFVLPVVDELSKAVATSALLSGAQVLCGDTKRRRWGAFQGWANFHCYSARQPETLLAALGEAVAILAPLASERTPFQATSFAA